jgi:hypothetical protein
MRKKVLGTMFLLLIAGVLLGGCATPEDEYDEAQKKIQGAVNEWIADHGIGLPDHGLIINTSGCGVHIGPYPGGELINAGYVLDFCYLVGYCTKCENYEFFPFELPICCYGQSGQEGTNFYTGNCTNPYQGHYIWLVDDVNTVCSVCVGDDCWANNESGYQGVWP